MRGGNQKLSQSAGGGLQLLPLYCGYNLLKNVLSNRATKYKHQVYLEKKNSSSTGAAVLCVTPFCAEFPLSWDLCRRRRWQSKKRCSYGRVVTYWQSTTKWSLL